MQRRTRPKAGRKEKPERRSDWQGALSISPSLRLPFYPEPLEAWEEKMAAMLSATYTSATRPLEALEYSKK